MPPPLPAPHDPYIAFRAPSYRFYWLGGFISVIGRQMVAVAVGYQVYQKTHSSTALGLVGLMGALPILLLSLPAGQLADRLNRKWIIITAQAALIATSLGLAWLAREGSAVPLLPLLAGCSRSLAAVAGTFREHTGVVFGPEIPVIYLLLLINGVARAFGWSARSPFMANIVPRAALPNAVMWNSSNFEIGSIVGPALAGLLIASFGFSCVYLLDVAGSAVFIAAMLAIPYRQPRPQAPAHPLGELFSGLRFVWEKKVILATLTLDLFAVLLGGAIALLPIFADRILHVGAVGLGWLRAAPSFGAVAMGLLLAHLPPMRRAGLAMLAAVAGFGAATVIFGLSRSFWLSLAALVVTGACDNISVVVRHTLVQLLTPDAMRGRVSAVNNVFIGSSNELGALESGLTAALFGPIVSVVGGGIGTIFVVLWTLRQWPEVLAIGPLQQVEPVAPETTPEERPA